MLEMNSIGEEIGQTEPHNKNYYYFAYTTTTTTSTTTRLVYLLAQGTLKSHTN